MDKNTNNVYSVVERAHENLVEGMNESALVREMMNALSYEYEDSQNRLTMKKRIF